MYIFKLTGRFYDDDSGAVTVDWVVLTAAVLGLSAVAMAGLRGNIASVGLSVANFLSGATINTSF